LDFEKSRFVGHKPNTSFYAGYRLFTPRQYCGHSEFWAISFIFLPDFRAENKFFPNKITAETGKWISI